MRRLTLALIAAVVLVGVNLSAQKAQSYSGEIMDSQCAFLSGHSNMAKQGESAKDCTNRCVMLGGKYVLFDGANKTTYQLDDQKKAAQFAGAKVKVDGTLNATTKTIHVTDIKAGA